MSPLKRMAILGVILLIYYVRENTTFVGSPNYTIFKFDRISNYRETDFAKIDKVVVAVVACESRLQETINLLKSVLIFTKTVIQFLIFTDEYHNEITDVLTRWRQLHTWNKMDFRLLKLGSMEFHNEHHSAAQKRCEAQKVLLPKLLPDIDALIYIETDTMFLGPIDDLWQHFFWFESFHIAAMTRDPDADSIPILMNLTRMRDYGWVHYVNNTISQYKLHADLNGQDVMDIIFNRHSTAVLDLSCRYNYQTSMCEYSAKCGEASRNGILLLHNSRLSPASQSQYPDEYHPTYAAIYGAFNDFEVGAHPKSILGNLQLHLGDSSPSACDSMVEAFMLVPRETFARWPSRERIVMSIVACDSYFKLALTAMKSVLIFTRTPVYFILFTEDEMKPQMVDTLFRWKTLTHQQLEFEVHSVNFPVENQDEWRNMYYRCASEKLFLTTLLPHIDALIYVDAGTLFLGPADELWGIFKDFTKRQMCAMAADHYIYDRSYYAISTQNPHYGRMGLHSGVMLMNLTRMREFGWTNRVIEIQQRRKDYLTRGDQDIINIIFNNHSDGVTELLCRFNFRNTLCDDKELTKSHIEATCPDAALYGINVLHAANHTFNNKKHAFSAIYHAMEAFHISEDTKLLPVMMKWYLETKPKSFCTSLLNVYLNVFNETVSSASSDRPHIDSTID